MVTEKALARKEFEKGIREETFFDIKMIFWLARLLQQAQGQTYTETPKRLGMSVMHYADLTQENRRRHIQIMAEARAHHQAIAGAAQAGS